VSQKVGRRGGVRWGLPVGIVLAIMLLPASRALAAPGDLDTSFSADGKQTLNFGGTDRASHVVITPDGRIVVVGSSDATGGGDYAVARFTADGTPDSSFNASGEVTVGTQPTVSDVGGGVVVLPDERIVVSGAGNSTIDFVTKLLNANGSVDPTFAGTGTSVVDFGATDIVNAMIRQPDGKLVLVGTTGTGNPATTGDFAIARLNADGTPDTSFSGDGKQTVDLGGLDSANAVAIQPDGKLVIAGQGGAANDMAVIRLNPDGSLDTSFAPMTSGKAFVDFGGTDGANGAALQPDGKIVLVGSTSAVGSGDFAVARLNPDGSVDPTFSGDGKLTLGYAAPGELGLAVAVQQNGRIVVMGNGDVNNDFVVSRLAPDGSIDSTFGTGGTVGVDFGAVERDGDVTLQPDGQIVVAGSTSVNDADDFAVARLQGDPVQSTTTTTTSAVTTPAPSPPPPSSPVAVGPTPRISSGGPSAKLPGGWRFGGFDSSAPLKRRIIDYHWIISFLNKTVDTDCGPSPVMSIPIKATGIYKSRLIVTDSSGATASTQRFIPIHKLKIKPTSGDGVFDCENPAHGNQASTADCVKSYGFGILDVNSRGGANDCFHVTGTVGSKSFYEGKVSGPVAINGLYVPVPKGVTTVYDSDGNVSVEGASNIPVRIGPFLTQDIPLKFKVQPNKFLVYHLINIDSATNTPKFLGSLPIRGAFSIDLLYHKSWVKVGIGLPSPLSFGGKRAAQADVLLKSDNVNGLQYDGLSATVPDVWLGPLYVSSLNVHYQKSTNTWGGGAKVTLPGSQIAINAAGPPTQPPDFGFGIKNGKLDHAGFGVDFQPPTQPDLFPPFHTVLLSHIGASVGFNPLRLTGTIGLSAANLVAEDGALFGVFASAGNQYTLPEDPGPELAPLASRTFDRFSLAIGGTAALKVPILGDLPLLHAYGLYEYPDYFEFGGGFSFGVSVVSLTGDVGGFVYPSSRKFNVQGGVKACLRNVKIGYKFVSIKVSPCINVGAVVSSRGFGFCGIVPVPFPIFGTIPVTVGAGYHWGDGGPKLMIFSCDYGPYAEASPLAHTSAAAAAGSYTVNLPNGLPAAMFQVRGLGGDPDVTVTDPHGHDAFATADALSLNGADPNTTTVALRHPLGGRWTITPKAGSVAIAGVASANALPPVALKATVSGSGHRRVLHYRLNPASGRTVTFVEHGPDTVHVLGVAHGRAGQITFSPGTGRRGRRTIAALVDQAGAPAGDVKIASYSAPGPGQPGRPGRVRATRRRGAIRVSWRSVPGATRYEVLVKLADHSQVFRVVRRTHVTIVDPAARTRGRVLVDAIGLDGGRGRVRTVSLPRARRTR
jgi:uncharacterized delta-60 repeat protein